MEQNKIQIEVKFSSGIKNTKFRFTLMCIANIVFTLFRLSRFVLIIRLRVFNKNIINKVYTIQKLFII